MSNKYVDQYRVEAGWRYTEDISFETQISLPFGPALTTISKIPITFAQSPLRLFQSVPEATHAFLVLRHLDIDVARPVPHFFPTWQWNQTLDSSFSAASGGGTVVLTYASGPAPSGDLVLAVSTALALRRIQLGTLPSGVTITKVEVKPGWASIYDNLHLTSPVSGSVDLAQFYDSQYGIMNAFTTIQTSTIINVRLTYTNSNGSATSTPYQFYGLQQGYQSAQWKIEYQSPMGGVYVVSEYDDRDTPSRTIVLDKMIPLQLTDSGQTNFGTFIFTANNQMAWTGLSSSYNIMLTATVAYLIPD